ncbi:neurofilament medium polypeptide-like isoform X4 [Hyla sarda]|uniref:neurofilament medium polypeptide-like isoform X4 n=1 Tax=Hyla sarda TaxID=327740 RepID=UPI0024C40CF5|nr:neurofilament medium polypeptide-like isoform X4 [Hyla sarda]
MEVGPHEFQEPEGGAMERRAVSNSVPSPPWPQPSLTLTSPPVLSRCSLYPQPPAETKTHRASLLVEDNAANHRPEGESSPSFVPRTIAVPPYHHSDPADLLPQAMLAAGLPTMHGGLLVLPVPPQNVMVSQDIDGPILKMSDRTLLDHTVMVPLYEEDPKWGKSLEEVEMGCNTETSDDGSKEDEGDPFRWMEGTNCESLGEEEEECDDGWREKDEDEEQSDEDDDNGGQSEGISDEDDAQSEGISDEEDEFYDEELGEEADDERTSDGSDEERPERKFNDQLEKVDDDDDDVGQGEFSSFPSSRAVDSSVTPARPNPCDQRGTAWKETDPEEPSDEELKKVYRDLRQDLHQNATLFKAMMREGLQGSPPTSPLT